MQSAGGRQQEPVAVREHALICYGVELAGRKPERHMHCVHVPKNEVDGRVAVSVRVSQDTAELLGHRLHDPQFGQFNIHPERLEEL